MSTVVSTLWVAKRGFTLNFTFSPYAGNLYPRPVVLQPLQEELPLPPSSPLVRAGLSDKRFISLALAVFFCSAVTPKRYRTEGAQSHH